MGTAELKSSTLIIHSHIFTYGNAATEELTQNIRDEIETLWNEPQATVFLNDVRHPIIFNITASFAPAITPLDVYKNLDARNNYFRIEEFAFNNISFVDGLGCNSGYFKLENLYKGSTTAAHEGVPGIMYPRGTLVDPPFQYEPDKAAGTKGGTMHPMYRKVKQEDIELLNLHKLHFENNIAILGEFTSVWHDAHKR